MRGNCVELVAVRNEATGHGPRIELTKPACSPLAALEQLAFSVPQHTKAFAGGIEELTFVDIAVGQADQPSSRKFAVNPHARFLGAVLVAHASSTVRLVLRIER